MFHFDLKKYLSEKQKMKKLTKPRFFLERIKKMNCFTCFFDFPPETAEEFIKVVEKKMGDFYKKHHAHPKYIAVNGNFKANIKKLFSSDSEIMKDFSDARDEVMGIPIIWVKVDEKIKICSPEEKIKNFFEISEYVKNASKKELKEKLKEIQEKINLYIDYKKTLTELIYQIEMQR